MASLIFRIPFVVEKVKNFVRGGSMILLSSYLLYKNYESFKRAKDFRRDVDTHQYEFESLREELVPIKDYVDRKSVV